MSFIDSLTNIKQARMIFFLSRYLHKTAFLCSIRYLCPLESLEYQNIVVVLVLYVALTLAVARFRYMKFSSHPHLLFLCHFFCTSSFVAYLKITECFKSRDNTICNVIYGLT
jgi:hypothetical protein